MIVVALAAAMDRHPAVEVDPGEVATNATRTVRLRGGALSGAVVLLGSGPRVEPTDPDGLALAYVLEPDGAARVELPAWLAPGTYDLAVRWPDAHQVCAPRPLRVTAPSCTLAMTPFPASETRPSAEQAGALVSAAACLAAAGADTLHVIGRAGRGDGLVPVPPAGDPAHRLPLAWNAGVALERARAGARALAGARDGQVRGLEIWGNGQPFDEELEADAPLRRIELSGSVDAHLLGCPTPLVGFASGSAMVTATEEAALAEAAACYRGRGIHDVLVGVGGLGGDDDPRPAAQRRRALAEARAHRVAELLAGEQLSAHRVAWERWGETSEDLARVIPRGEWPGPRHHPVSGCTPPDAERRWATSPGAGWTVSTELAAGPQVGSAGEGTWAAGGWAQARGGIARGPFVALGVGAMAGPDVALTPFVAVGTELPLLPAAPSSVWIGWEPLETRARAGAQIVVGRALENHLLLSLATHAALGFQADLSWQAGFGLVVSWRTESR